MWVCETTIIILGGERRNESKTITWPRYRKTSGRGREDKGRHHHPHTAKEKPVEGKVVAVGDGKTGEDGKKIALEVKAGDKVLFGKYAGTEIQIDGEEHLIMREDDIIAIVE